MAEMLTEPDELLGELVLPTSNPVEWAFVVEVLGQPIERLADLDTIITRFSALDRDPRVCTFFATIPGSEEAGEFDFERFLALGVPLIVDVALEMPKLFDGIKVPIHMSRSSCAGPGNLGKRSFSLTRRQCACLLAHSFFGSLKRPPAVHPNDFRFTVVDLFLGSARSPNSATTFLNYFSVLGKNGVPDEFVTFERQGYRKGPPPWKWEESDAPLCAVDIVDGNIENSAADLHAEFANAFVGGGVMTGDAAMEEMLFLVKPELLVAMAIENRMVDEEAICISGARQYSLTTGFGHSFAFAGDYDDRRAGPPPRVCALDAIRGGGPAMTRPALLRDMNKARVAFTGAQELATGHWGCGAFGNHHDLMFLKQWLAASHAGVSTVYYHDFNRNQSHHIVPLVRKLRHLTVARLWAFLLEITGDLSSAARFSARVADIAIGRVEIPTGRGGHGPSPTGAATAGDGGASSEGDAVAIAAGSAYAAAVGKATATRPVDEQPSASEPKVAFSIKELRAGTPAGVDPTHKESHLSAAEFEAHLGVTRSAWEQLPKWKRDKAKTRAGIF